MLNNFVCIFLFFLRAALIFGLITCVAGIVGVIIGSASSQYFRRGNARADPLICAIGVLGSVPLVYAGVVIADENLTWSWVRLKVYVLNFCQLFIISSNICASCLSLNAKKKICRDLCKIFKIL